MAEETTLYQQIGYLQGQMQTIQTNQHQGSQQMISFEKRITVEIEKLVHNMNSRISTVEADRNRDNLRIHKIKWNLSLVTVAATTIANLAVQFFFHFAK